MAGDKFIESSYEKALIALFQELGYTYECGYDVEKALKKSGFLKTKTKNAYDL